MNSEDLSSQHGISEKSWGTREYIGAVLLATGFGIGIWVFVLITRVFSDSKALTSLLGPFASAVQIEVDRTKITLPDEILQGMSILFTLLLLAVLVSLSGHFLKAGASLLRPEITAALTRIHKQLLDLSKKSNT